MKEFLSKKFSLLIVLALIAAYSAFFSAYSIQRQNTFRTRASDMGQMDQALWNTLHGNLLQDTRPDGHQAPRLTDHVEPIFLIIPFAFLINDSIETLFILQSIALALGALPIFWIARRRLQNDVTAIFFAAMYLMFPALQAANLAEFHAVTFAPAPLLCAYYFAQERDWKRYAIFSVLALAVKEEIALLVFAMGVWAAMKKSQVPSPKSQVTSRKFQVAKILGPATWGLRLNVVPLVIAILSLLWFFVAVFVIVPHFAPAGRSVYVGRYTCASDALRDPLTALPNLFACVFIPEKISYLAQLFASTGLLALFDPLPLLVGAPSLVLNLLSSYDAQYSGTYHYSAPVAPFFVLAAIGGAQRITNSKIQIPNLKTLALALGFLIAFGYHLFAGYTPIGGEFFWTPTTAHQQLLARFLSQIPRDAPVTTTATLFPHLSHRRVLYRFPLVNDAQFVLLDVSQAAITNPIDYAVNYRAIVKQGFGIRDAADGYILLERGRAQKELPDAFYDFARARGAEPQYRAQIDFEDKLRFIGFDVR
ncbi:MAG: DUF2079 domain-containing protein, partial [Chloroflexi bacterium]|nr:DUF2079 domain-containing protein [Chloroflexota bacterium]